MDLSLFKRRRVFISHASANHAWVDLLTSALAGQGVHPFVDHDLRGGVLPGEEWQKALSKDLKRTNSVLLLITPEWRESSWCQAEYKTALLLEKPIIPLVLGDTPHSDIEPQRQKIFLDPVPGEVDSEVVGAIVRAIPSRGMSGAWTAFPFAMFLGILSLGAELDSLGPWEILGFEGGAFTDLAQGVGDSRLVYAASSNQCGRSGVFESVDSGNSWKRLDVPLLEGDAKRVAVSDREILVAADGAAFFMDRGKRNWKTLELGGLSSDFLFLEPVPGRPHELVWGTLKPGGMSFVSGAGLAASADERTIAAETKPGGFGKKRSDGSTAYFPFQANDISFHPLYPNVAVFATPNEDALVVSSDGLESFRSINSYPGKKPLRVLIDASGESLLAGGRDGLWRARFSDWASENPEFEHVLDQAFESVCLFEGRDRFYAGSDCGLFFASKRDGVFAPHPLNPPLLHINDLVENEAGDLLVATGGGGVFLQRASRGDWSQTATAGPMETFYGWSCPEYSLVGSGPLLFLSVDGGESYSIQAGLPANLLCVLRVEGTGETAARPSHRLRSRESRGHAAFEEDCLVASFGEKGLFRKRGGETRWEPVEGTGPGVAGTIAQSKSRPGHLLATLDRKVVQSRNSGQSWESLGIGRDVTAHAVFADPDEGFWISGERGAVSVLLRCVDDGAVLTTRYERTAEAATTAFAESPRGGRIFGATDGFVFATRLDGENESFEERGKIPISRSTWLEFAVAGGGRIYAASMEEGAFSSGDGGTSWEPVAFNSLLREGGSRIHGVRLDPSDRPEFYTDLGVIRARRKWALRIGRFALTWSPATVSRRCGLMRSWP